MSFVCRYAHGLVRHRLIIAAAILSAVGVALTSRDLFMTPIAAATMAGIVVVLLHRFWHSGQWSAWKHVRTAHLLSVAVVPVAFSTGLSVNSDHLFRQAFDVEVPAGVRNLTVDANLLNPSGYRTVLMRFEADAGTLAELLTKDSFEPDPQMQDAWAANESWSNIVHQAFADFGRFGGEYWAAIPPMLTPDFRHWHRSSGKLRTDTRVLWDNQSGQAFVLYTVR